MPLPISAWPVCDAIWRLLTPRTALIILGEDEGAQARRLAALYHIELCLHECLVMLAPLASVLSACPCISITLCLVKHHERWCYSVSHQSQIPKSLDAEQPMSLIGARLG